jgi:simple sugar transport system permease protein
MLRVPGLYQLPIIGRGFFMQSPVLYVAVAVAVLLWLMLRFTRMGLIIRAVGEGADAADAAGISVTMVRFGAMAFTGLCAGVAGGYLTLVASGGVFVDNAISGRGYLAVATVIFSRWNPLWILLASVLFGFADAMQYQGQEIGLSISPELLLMLPFVLALLAWVLIGNGNSGPSEMGLPFLRARK